MSKAIGTLEQPELRQETATRPGAVASKPGLVGSLTGYMRSFSMSPRTKNLLKLAISAVLFISLFAFGKVDLSQSWQAALSANKTTLGLAFLIYTFSGLIIAYRWQLLATAVDFHERFYKMAQYTYVGMFFNMFLPSTVGGDFTKCYYLTKGKEAKGTSKYLHALSTVLIDRAIGIAVLLVFATIGLLYGPATSLPLEMKAPVFAMTFGVCIVLPFLPQISNRLLGESNWLSKKLNHSTVRVYWQNKPTMLKALALSIIFQMLMVCTHILVGMSLGLDFSQVSFWYYFVFYPLVAVLGFVTPSVNGIGVREWAYTYFLTASNVESSTALTYALIWLGMTASGSIIGGIVYVLGHFRIPNQETGQSKEPFEHNNLADQTQST